MFIDPSLTPFFNPLSHVRLDGTLSQKAREKVVHKFTSTPRLCILLASLKAGGVGLNLVAATRVYLMDAWWNSSVRVHYIWSPLAIGYVSDLLVLS